MLPFSLLQISVASPSAVSASLINININVNVVQVDQDEFRNENFGIPWNDDQEPNIFTCLSWHFRVTKDIWGRDNELRALNDWADSQQQLSLKIIRGEGGTGKTRLGAQFGENLKNKGWNAGFFKHGESSNIALHEDGTLIIVDYPEENLSSAKSLMQALSSGVSDKKIRVLFLTRKPQTDWMEILPSWHIEHLVNRNEITLSTLGTSDAPKLYINALMEYATHEGTDPQQFTNDELEDWLAADDENKRPLYILALALYSALHPHEKPTTIKSREIIEALVLRERTRLQNESEQLWGREFRLTLEYAAALATLANGFTPGDLDMCRSSSELSPFFPKEALFPSSVRESSLARGDYIPPLKPDLIAAAFVYKVLTENKQFGPELLWQGIMCNFENAFDRFTRLCHDAVFSRNVRNSVSRLCSLCRCGTIRNDAVKSTICLQRLRYRSPVSRSRSISAESCWNMLTQTKIKRCFIIIFQTTMLTKVIEKTL